MAADLSADSPQRRKRTARKLSPIDAMIARERGAMELQLRRNAVLQYVGEQLAQLNAMLREAGYGQVTQPIMQVPSNWNPQQFVQPQQPQAIARPCVWCGKPGTPTNVGNGVIQDLCILHARAMRMQAAGPDGSFNKAAAQGFSVDKTDAPRAPAQPVASGKVIMHPIGEDVARAQQHAAEANGTPIPPAGFEEMPDESA
jgi:hypothetical protein